MEMISDYVVDPFQKIALKRHFLRFPECCICALLFEKMKHVERLSFILCDKLRFQCVCYAYVFWGEMPTS